jgi:hypothetical protein
VTDRLDLLDQPTELVVVSDFRFDDGKLHQAQDEAWAVALTHASHHFSLQGATPGEVATLLGDSPEQVKRKGDAEGVTVLLLRLERVLSVCFGPRVVTQDEP